ncbi:hypothetical protein A8B76_05085 [Roseovarius indicus]|nr:hypothetical protein A8B76_05085 [Roseovarius indicus]
MAELERQTSADALLVFLTLTHPDLGQPVRVVSDHPDFSYVLDGETYQGLPFDGGVLTDNDQMPSAELIFPNVDRRIGFALERSTNRATIDLAVYSSADFDLTVNPRTEIGTASKVYSFVDFYLSEVQVDAIAIRGRITLRDYAQEPWPYLRATQDRCPGLFK